MPVPNMDMILMFVASPSESARFYEKLFGLKPLEESPTFALFALPNGIQIGLWSHKTAEPKVSAKAGACEIAFSDDHVDEVFKAWQKKGIAFVQHPTDMDFGRTFVALDPDGHRIRVYKVWEEGR